MSITVPDDGYLWILTLDLAVWVSVLIYARRFLTAFHPLSWYLLWHFICTTRRLFQFELGAAPLYANSPSLKAVTADEIARAVFWNDAGLVMFSLGAATAHMVRMKGRSNGSFRRIDPRRARIVIWAMMIPGSVCFILMQALSRAPFDAAGIGQYILIVSMWPLTLLGILAYCNGLSRHLLAGTVALMGVTALQGYHRFMVVIPAAYLALLYLMRTRAKFRAVAKLALPALALSLLMPHMKVIGRAFQDGDYNFAFERASSALTLSSDDLGSPVNFLDQFAATLSLVDGSERLLYGETYTSVVIMWVPRAVWPGKPHLGQHVIDIATVDRPFDKEGRIITILGEAYLNFAAYGLCLVPFLVAYLFTRCYRIFLISPPQSLFRLAFLFLTPAAIQMYRDGLASMALFGVLFNAPLIAIWLFSCPSRTRRHQASVTTQPRTGSGWS